MKDCFEKRSYPLNEDLICAMEGKKIVGEQEGANLNISALNNEHMKLAGPNDEQDMISPRNKPGHTVVSKLTRVDGAKGNENQQVLGFDGIFSSPGGKYSGPKLADVAKSIQDAKGGVSASKRKNREGSFDPNGLHLSRRRKRIFEENEGGCGPQHVDELEGETISNNDG
jgi:hypothetical protein